MGENTKQKKLGDILLQLRKKENITKKCLCSGICTVRTLDRIENGVGKPDKWIVDALFSRLGKTTMDIEYYVSEKTYRLQEMRIGIREAYWKNDKKKMQNLLTDYEMQMGGKSPLHEQFIYYGKALLAGSQNGWKNKSRLLEQALICTIPDFQNLLLKDCFLSSEEICIFLCLANTYETEGRETSAKQIRKECYDYLCQERISEEYRLIYLPSLAIRLADHCLKQKKYNELWKLSEQIVQMLQNHQELFLLSEMMIYQLKAKQEEKYSIENRLFTKHMKLNVLILSNIMEEYREFNYSLKKDYLFNPVEMKRLLRSQSSYHLIGDDIRARRQYLGMTQQELCNDICSKKTLINIESRKSSPQKELYLGLMNRLSDSDIFYEDFIDVSNFSADGRRAQMERMMDEGNYIDAEILFKKLELDFTKGDNDIQYQILMQTRINVHLYQLEPVEALEKMEDALSYTLSDYKNKRLRFWCLSNNEVKLLIQIAILYAEMGKMEDTIHILIELRIHYEISTVNIRYHLKQYKMVLHYLAKYWGKMEEHEKALGLVEKLIHLSVEWGDASVLSASLYAKAWNIEKMMDRVGEYSEDQIRVCKKTLMQAFGVNIVMKSPILAEYVAEHYKSRYGTELMLTDLLE